MHFVDALQVRALRMIAGVAFFVLSRFPRTLEQDKQLLAEQSLPDDLSMAVQFRLAKKQIMAQLLHDLASRIKVGLETHHGPSICHRVPSQALSRPLCERGSAGLPYRRCSSCAHLLHYQVRHHEGAGKCATLINLVQP